MLWDKTFGAYDDVFGQHTIVDKLPDGGFFVCVEVYLKMHFNLEKLSVVSVNKWWLSVKWCFRGKSR